NPRLVVKATYKIYGAPPGDLETNIANDVRTVETTAAIFKDPADTRQWGELSSQEWNELIAFAGVDAGYTVENTPYADYFDPQLLREVNEVDMSLAAHVAKTGRPL